MSLTNNYVYKILFFMYYKILSYIKRFFYLLKQRIDLLICIFIAYKTKRNKAKPFDVGIGPIPLINNVYHKRALEKYGYKTNTFSFEPYFITSEFDFFLDRQLNKFWLKHFRFPTLFWYVAKHHKCLYFYFDGCVLSGHDFLRKHEARLYKLAGIKTVVMPYGGDVHDMLMSKNLQFKNAMSVDYPTFKTQRRLVYERVERWTNYADHVISGCDWVEYTYHWDTLMLAHFSIDTSFWKPTPGSGNKSGTFKILHAPNHRTIKGTRHFERAVKELREEGLNIELVIRQKAPNTEIKKLVEECDVIADQLLIGWYAMFAIEAMAMEKPVICYLKDDLVDLFEENGLVTRDEIPLVNADYKTVKDVLRKLYVERDSLHVIGKRSREYVQKYHSTEYIGSVFHKINTQLQLSPRLKPEV